MDNNAIVRLGFALTTGVEKYEIEDKTYTAEEAVEVLRAALVEANGGSTKFDYKSLRRNKAAIFEIIEELVSVIIQEGLTGSEFWNNYVDYKNVKLGDKNEFWIEDNSTFVVCEVANGNSTPRRQRLGKAKRFSVNTAVHSIRMYDHFSRFMSGRIDWAQLCAKVADSFQKEIWNDIYTAFAGITTDDIVGGSGSSYITTGSWDEDDLIDIIAHVEAATGASAKIFGTKKALKKMATSIVADSQKEDIYNNGHVGKFYSNDVFELRQIHAAGTDSFVLSDNDIYVVAGDDKFIKFVDEGETLIDDRDYTQNADSTIEYRMTQMWGVGVAFASKSFGKYTIS